MTTTKAAWLMVVLLPAIGACSASKNGDDAASAGEFGDGRERRQRCFN